MNSKEIVDYLKSEASEKYKENYVAEAINEIGYKLGEDSASSDSLTLSNRDDSLYVIASEEKAIGMWIASPCYHSVDYRFLMQVRANALVFGGNYDASGGFRPLVCLNSNVELLKKEEGVYSIK